MSSSSSSNRSSDRHRRPHPAHASEARDAAPAHDDSDATFVPPRFGTDGLRGRAGTPPMDAPTLQRVGAAIGLWLQGRGPERKRVVIGNDGRESGPWIMDALAQGLTATEVTAEDVGLVTTPALAHLTRRAGAVAGIMISASHNPPEDNGVKVFDGDGYKLAAADEQHIESLTRSAAFEPRPPRIKLRRELQALYEEHLHALFGHLDLRGRTIVVDAANGGGSRLAPAVLRQLGADVVEVACSPDGHNINQGVGALHPENLVPVVLERRAALGICLDGDGDRGIFVDDAGTVRDGDDVLAVLGLHLHAAGRLPHGTVVATVMSNLGLRQALAASGVQLHTTPVGDRAVVQAMRAGGFALGGEQSGHIVLDGEGRYTGDGLFTALQLLSLPDVLQTGMARAFGVFRRCPQVLQNVQVRSKPDLQALVAVQEAVRTAEAEMGDQGRVLLRYSGTEPLCRVMVEGADAALVHKHVQAIAAAVCAAIGQP